MGGERTERTFQPLGCVQVFSRQPGSHLESLRKGHPDHGGDFGELARLCDHDAKTCCFHPFHPCFLVVFGRPFANERESQQAYHPSKKHISFLLRAQPKHGLDTKSSLEPVKDFFFGASKIHSYSIPTLLGEFLRSLPCSLFRL